MKSIKYDEFIKCLEEEIKGINLPNDTEPEIDPEINPVDYGYALGLKVAKSYAISLATDIIKNKDGCTWQDGVGTSPKGHYCGECDMINKDTCIVREEEKKHE